MERGEEERAGAARRIEDGDLAERLPEGTDQFRPFAAGDHVPGELLDVQVVRDEVVDGRDLARGEPGADLLVAPAAGDVLAPRLGGQSPGGRRGPVPAVTFGHVAHAGGDLRRQFALRGQGLLLVDVVRHAVAHRVVEVAVRVVGQQPPHPAAGLEGDGAFLPRAVEQERDDGVAADVPGDVLLRVVGPHLLLVDVLLEDVAEHVGVDLVVVAQRPVVEVPLVRVEEREDPLEGFVGDADFRIVALQVVRVEQAAVEVGDPAEQRRQFRGALGLGPAQALVEQPQQEQPVEAVEPAGAAGRPAHALQAVAQVVRVAVEEAALLDEVDEHHPVEHQRGVPFPVGRLRDPFDEVQERAVLLPETVVEPPGHLLHVEGRAHPPRHVDDGQVFLFVQGEDELLELLDQRLARLIPAPEVGAGPVGASRLALDPLPVLRAAAGRGVHDDVLADGPGDGLLDLLAGGVVREGCFRVGDVLVDHHPALVRDGFENERAARDRGLDVRAAVVPAELVDEQPAQVEALQTTSDGLPVESGLHRSTACPPTAAACRAGSPSSGPE